ncbi:MAG: hypothetical protein IRY87_03510 [Acetobacteraceae bacterium]|nr:hypothetical protein [Acetobacteraceae bacterium]
MDQGTGKMRLMGWRAGIARLLAVAFLLASLLVPPFVESASASALPITVTAAAAVGQDGSSPGTPSRPDGIVHLGAHCACQLADRLTPPEPVAPATFGAVVHPTLTAHALASLEAEPPARPPQA